MGYLLTNPFTAKKTTAPEIHIPTKKSRDDDKSVPMLKLKLITMRARIRHKTEMNLSSQTLKELPTSSKSNWLSARTTALSFDLLEDIQKTTTAKTPNKQAKKEQQKENLPDTWYFSSNHILVNRERALIHLPQLRRCRYLDDLARFHAQDLAEIQGLFHSVKGGAAELQKKVKSDVAGENIQRGKSIRSMHSAMMTVGKQSRTNILSPKFTEFGMGTAKGEDGKLYMVQLFRGEPNV